MACFAPFTTVKSCFMSPGVSLGGLFSVLLVFGENSGSTLVLPSSNRVGDAIKAALFLALPDRKAAPCRSSWSAPAAAHRLERVPIGQIALCDQLRFNEECIVRLSAEATARPVGGSSQGRNRSASSAQHHELVVRDVFLAQNTVDHWHPSLFQVRAVFRVGIFAFLAGPGSTTGFVTQNDLAAFRVTMVGGL